MFHFEDINFVVCFSIVIVLIVVLLLLILVFILSQLHFKKYDRSLHSQSNSVRVFVINVTSGTVLFFNRSNLKNRRMMTINDFYNQFYSDDRSRVENWISELSSPGKKDVLYYLEADVVLQKSRKICYSLLELVSSNTDKGIIHLESHILRYALPNAKVKTSKGIITTTQEMKNKFNVGSGVQRGMTFLIRFYNAKRKVFKESEMDGVLFSKLKDQLQPFALTKQKRSLIEVGSNDVAIVDFKINRRNDALFLGHSIAHSILRYITLNGLLDDVGFSIGIVENRMFSHSFDDVVKHGVEAALLAQEKKTSVIFYDEIHARNIDNDVYSQEIQQILRDKNLYYCYRPILNVDDCKVVGYLSYAKTIHSVFTSLKEIKEYATVGGLDKALFSTVARNIIPRYISSKNSDDERLFFDVLLSEKESIFNVIKHINRIKDVKLVLTFSELDLSKYSNNVEMIISSFNDLKASGFEISLSLCDKEMLLASSVYEQFDFFIIGSDLSQDIYKYSDKTILYIRSTIEKLLKYKKPIIATNLYGWNSIELMIKLGINYISSDELGPADTMVLPIDKKKIQKVKSINNY